MKGDRCKSWILLIWLFLVGEAIGQVTVTMSNGYCVIVDGTTNLSGTIYDDGQGSDGQYSNNFHGQVQINAYPGDTIEIWGTYETEQTYDVLSIYNYDLTNPSGGGTQLAALSGSGNISYTSLTGCLSMDFSSDGSVCHAGFEIHFLIKPTGCVNPVHTIIHQMLTATSVRLEWSAVDMTDTFLISYGTTDTLVSGSICDVRYLTPDSDYIFRIISVTDTANPLCIRTYTLRTPCFSARVDGLRPLCGIDTLTLSADSADGFLWSTGDTSRSILVWDTGGYYLVAFTQGGCSDTSYFRVGMIQPELLTRLPNTLCAGDTAMITVGLSEGSSIQVLMGESTLSESNCIFLPDGEDCPPHGCSYRSELTFSGFGEEAHISNINDIRYVMLNIEHSFIGDIYINITCPNSQSADIMRYGGMGSSVCNSSIGSASRGWQEGTNAPVSIYFGLANDMEGTPTCDSSAYGNSPGVPWRYCWSNCNDAGFVYAADDAIIYRSNNVVGNSIDSSNVAAGINFYHPDQSFGALVGCPMNGTWYIEVIDGWGGDNGYIFGWELALDPERLLRNDYVPSVAYADIIGAYATRYSDTAFTIVAPLHRTTDTTVTYTVRIMDTMGCEFDTSFVVIFRASPPTIVSDTIVENELPHLFNGVWFSSDTSTAVFHSVSSSGCDSLLLYSLFVHRNSEAAMDSSICESQLPFHWYHRTFTASGTQYDTLANHVGADSLLTLTLHVIPSVNEDIYDSVCDNQSRIFEQTTYTAAGDYPHHFLSSQGCDSTRTLHLTLLHTTQGDTTASACNQFIWNGHTYTTNEVVTVSDYSTNAAGCDSAVALHLTILPSYDISIYDTICSNQAVSFEGGGYSVAGVYSATLHTVSTPQCDSVRTLYLAIRDTSVGDTFVICCDRYTWYGRNYSATTEDELVRHYSNAVGCDSAVVLHLTVHHSSHTDYYDTCVENNLPRYFNGIAVMGDTMGVEVALTDIRGCDSVVDYQLHVWYNVSTVSDSIICDNGLTSFMWNGVVSTLNPIADGLGEKPLLYDTLYALLTTMHGADSHVTLVLHVKPTYRNQYSDTVCDDSTYTFCGDAFTSSGDYVGTFVSLLGCDSVVTLHLVVNPTYSYDFYDTVYLGDTVLFEGNIYDQPGRYAVHYSTDKGCDSTYTLHLSGRNIQMVEQYDSICQGDTLYFFGRPLTVAGTYVDTNFTGDFLLDDTVVTLHLEELPPLTAMVEHTYNCESPAHFVLRSSSEAPYLEWLGPFIAEGHEHDSVVTVPNSTDTVHYILYVDYRPEPLCPVTVGFDLAPIPVLEAVIDINPTAMTLDERHLTVRHVGSGRVDRQQWYVFYNDEYPFEDTVRQLQLTVPLYVDSVMIVLSIKNDMCTSTDTGHVDVLRTGILFPNVFAPSQERNSYFKAYTTAVSDFELWIYDRSGDLVFYSNDIEEGWDGTHNGQPCSQAAYVYKCRYRDEVTPSGWQTYIGTVTLIR